MELFGESVFASVLGNPPPEGGYQGEYIAALAQRVLAQHPELASTSTDDGSSAGHRECVSTPAWRYSRILGVLPGAL